MALTLDHARDLAGGDPVLSFSVTDTGIGIPAADQARIFDAYVRGSSGPDGAIEGLGLGLSIFCRLTEVLGDAEKVVHHAAAVAAGALGMRVLVVEDQPVNRMVARGCLERLGCQVLEAETGAESLRLARAGDFDLVLMDIDLPDMTGGEAARATREALDPAPRIAALTAHHVEDSPARRRR